MVITVIILVQVTPMHSSNSPQNDLDRFVFQVVTPLLENKEKNWGLQRILEEISLDRTSSTRYSSFRKNSAPKQQNLMNSYYVPETFDKEPIFIKHVIPFLVDLYSSMNRNTTILWCGKVDEIYQLFRKALELLDFEHSVEILDLKILKVIYLLTLIVLIFNFGNIKTHSDEYKDLVIWSYRRLIKLERQNVRSGQKPRRIVVINAIHNRFSSIVDATIFSAKTPFFNQDSPWFR